MCSSLSLGKPLRYSIWRLRRPILFGLIQRLDGCFLAREGDIFCVALLNVCLTSEKVCTRGRARWRVAWRGSHPGRSPIEEREFELTKTGVRNDRSPTADDECCRS